MKETDEPYEKHRIRHTYTTIVRFGIHGTDCPMCASVHEDDDQHYFPQKRREKMEAND